MTAADPSSPPVLGLVLPGGGARCAYQVGVLKAVAELARPGPLPFPVLSGTSAGALVAAVLAAHADDFQRGVGVLEDVWGGFTVGRVFRSDTRAMLGSGLKLLLALVSAGLLARPPRSLFDNAPLRRLLASGVDFDAIRANLARGHLRAFAITAAGYSTARSVSFVQAAEPVAPWSRAWRLGLAADITLDHLMASAAIPFLFPAVAMGGEYFGDGAMRQSAPLATPIHLGASRLLVIGVRGTRSASGEVPPREPTLGQVFGFMLDTLFADGLDSDLERMRRVNILVSRIAAEPGTPATLGLRPVEPTVFGPQHDLAELAARHAGSMPRSLRALLRAMGAYDGGGRQLLSYLLFEGDYTRALIAAGHADAMARRAELERLLGSAARSAAPAG